MKVKDCGIIKTVELLTRIDSTCSQDVADALNTLLDHGQNRIICNFANNQYISSAGLRVFLSVLKRTKKQGGQLVLCSLKPGILEIFNMAGFTKLFTICDSEEEAIASFTPAPSLKTSMVSTENKETVAQSYSGSPHNKNNNIDTKV